MKKIGLFIVFCAVISSVFAVPARRGGIVKMQPDGSKITVYQHGDEYFHWMTNEKGEWLRLAEDGFYQVTTTLRSEEIQAKRMTTPRRMSSKQDVGALNIAPRGLVILVNFTDIAFSTEKAEMDSMLIGKNYTRDYSYTYNNVTQNVHSTGSAWKYFFDSSYGQYDPKFDVVGPVTVSRGYAYYGQNDQYGSDLRPDIMVKEACEIADSVWNIDFTQYDNDGDGKVDFVYVIYAGHGESDGAASNTIWPHAWDLISAGTSCVVDEKRVSLYACGNELDLFTGHHTGIGTFCHEFSHVLGLPDLYETNTTPHGKKTLGEWDIMDYGPYNNNSNTPPAYSAYERFFMGWMTPRLITDPEKIVLEELNSSNTALLITTTDEHNLNGVKPSPTTFYLLENRQQIDWDEYLPGHGLMLTKIQYSSNKWTKNTVNNTATKMGVDLIEADGKSPDGSLGKAGDLFPTGATEYTLIADHSIKEIIERENTIEFIYKDWIGTNTENVDISQEVIAIYDILGQKQSSTDVSILPRGTYIIVTNIGTRKIIR